MSVLIDVFEKEMVDLDVLKEMSHEDLKSIGVNTFGQRHKILKEIRNLRSQNIVETILSSQTLVEFSCNSCERTFTSLNDLNEHMPVHVDNVELPTVFIQSENIMEESFSMTCSFM